MRSNLSPKEEHFAPAYAAGWVPRALPRIYLIGAMRAVAPGGSDFLPRGRKTRGLLAFLCLAGGERVSRNRLVGLLWDRRRTRMARMSLRQSLSELNGIVNRHVPGLVEIGRDRVRIDLGKCWVDALAILGASTDSASDSSNLAQLQQRAHPRRSRWDHTNVRSVAQGRANAFRGSCAENFGGGT